jgi:hypothetical protein
MLTHYTFYYIRRAGSHVNREQDATTHVFQPASPKVRFADSTQ